MQRALAWLLNVSADCQTDDGGRTLMQMDVGALVVVIALIGACAYGYQELIAKPKLAKDIAAGHLAAMGSIICPNQNCGYKGEPREESRGSIIVGLFLCCFFLLPGIIYFIVKSGHRRLCPKCGLQISVDN